MAPLAASYRQMRLGPALNVCIRCYDCDRRREIAHPRDRDHDDDGDDEDEDLEVDLCVSKTSSVLI
jgi:hypothetical protein